jgi:acetyl esterase/lipase
MRSHRRALISVLAAVVLAMTLGSCTRPGWPWPRATTTTRAVTTTTAGGPAVHGRYVDKAFTNVSQIATGVTYKAADAAAGYANDLKFDAWAPAGDKVTKRPAIVWAFGGAFVAGTRAMMNPDAQDSAQRGYVGITIDYRLQSGSGVLAVATGIVPAYQDMMLAGEWIRAHADEYGIDPDAIIAGGVSAGAINAVNTVILPGNQLVANGIFVPQGTVNPATTPYVAAISNSGAELGAIQTVVGMARNYSRPGQGPIIMFGGTSDTVVNYKNWQLKTCDDHKAAGNVCEFHSYANEGHGVISHIAELRNLSAAFVMREVLSKKGYSADPGAG